MNCLLHRGEAPLVISLPHTGTEVPSELLAQGVDPTMAIRDTDWRVDQLYRFAIELGATLVRTPVSRTAVDVNRDPSGASLYPGQATTGLVPTETFDGVPFYPGAGPDAAEIARRRAAYFDPYHTTLAAELNRLRGLHPRVVLYDGHSIRSEIPRLFAGTLPVFNIGTNSGAAADPALADAVARACLATGESVVLNGRFRGGWITRHYGRPETGIHAIQMELAQRLYMVEDDPVDPAEERFARAVAALTPVIAAALSWAAGR
jgi:N-formylglutamate deformylase